MQPVLTLKEAAALSAARDGRAETVEVSLDLGRTQAAVAVGPDRWACAAGSFPYLAGAKEQTVYYWDGAEFLVAARYDDALVKLVPTAWGPPTFQIDGVKMLPTAHVCPYADAGRKVALIKPRHKVVLDTCGGLGYFAAWCLSGEARRVLSYEINPAVRWLRQLNPWSPGASEALHLVAGDIAEEVRALGDASVDAVLHDPPRFALAGDLYAQVFYAQLARVLRRRGALFHYTGTPNALTSGRNVPNEVSQRLRAAGFRVRIVGDGVLGEKL